MYFQRFSRGLLTKEELQKVEHALEVTEIKDKAFDVSLKTIDHLMP